MTASRRSFPLAGVLASSPRLTPPAPGTDGATARATLPWLLRLRWAAFASQGALLATAFALAWIPRTSLPIVLLAAGLASNLALWIAVQRQVVRDDRRLVGTILLADIALLTGMLTVTGGPENPFAVVFLVHVALAAAALGPAWTWAVAAATTGGYASLFAARAASAHGAHATVSASHLTGMWVAFAATAALIAFFVTSISRALARREREVSDLRLAASRHEQLASLTTLAAGAAHELATPLATIAVAARELQHTVDAAGLDAASEDATLIRAQVDRCRDILDQMSGRAGSEAREPASIVAASELVDLVERRLRPHEARRLVVDGDLDAPVRVPRSGLAQSLGNLVRNAFDASADDATVSLHVRSSPERVRFAVEDHGAGMPPHVLARASEPFFTTKPAGAGYGLGLFLARVFAERYGGVLTIETTPGAGTTATLDFPRVSA